MPSNEQLAAISEALLHWQIKKRDLLNARADLDVDLANFDRRIADLIDELARLMTPGDEGER